MHDLQLGTVGMHAEIVSITFHKLGGRPCDPEGLRQHGQRPLLPERYQSKLWEHKPPYCLQVESEDERSPGKGDETPSPSQADRVCYSFLFCRVYLSP